MNTNTLKKFAQEARKKLIAQIGARLEYVIANTYTSALLEKRDQVKALNEAIEKSSKTQVIDKVAYTWFNRLMALRFMDVNDFQPLGIRVISPKDGFTTPELLDEVKQGRIPVEIQVKKDRIYDLLDGKVPGANPQNEVFQLLLIGACNHLHKTLPFLFERINDYTDLLLPDDLTSEFSIVQDIRNGMSVEDCKEVEIIGWLYQFYISEKKDQVFASGEKVKKEDIPAATQLFTPRWIVEYMVQNTVGKLWLQNRPNSKLKEHMPYYIESASVQDSDFLKINSVEEIKLLDQACGSGHILVYGFDLFYKIYEEEGYNPQEIPKLILEKNLYGFEIDERASQLASMALLMKARSYSKRLFRDTVSPNILFYEDLKLSKAEIEDTFRQIGVKPSDALLHDLKNMGQATNLGSLISPHTSLEELKTVQSKLQANSDSSDAFISYQVQQLQRALLQLILLGEKYHCVVDNPPYMGGGKMNNDLSSWVKTNFPDAKSDLLTCFVERGVMQIHENGFLGFVTMESWMFLSSFEDFRKKILENLRIHSLTHFGWHIMRIAFGTVSFILENKKPSDDFNGVYSYMEYDNIEKEAERPLVFPLQNNGRFKLANQKDFEKIPGSPIGYWLSENILEVFDKGTRLGEISNPCNGMNTTNNDIFVRLWHEVSISKIGFGLRTTVESIESKKKWFPYNKGGGFRKWYGNNYSIVNYEKGGATICNYIDNESGSKVKASGRVINRDKYFKKSITWSSVTSSVFSARLCKPGFVFDNGGSSVFCDDEYYDLISCFLGSRLAFNILKILNPTLNFQPGNLSALPIILEKFEKKGVQIASLSNRFYENFKKDWDAFEHSWDFVSSPFILKKNFSSSLSEIYSRIIKENESLISRVKQDEETNNQMFIDAYGLENELSASVPLNEITLSVNPYYSYRGETDQLNLSKLMLEDSIRDLFSYFVGCLFGRYSLDKEGLILANQGETLEDYLRTITLSARLTDGQGVEVSFLPDSDNIIPVLDDEWFEDDIVSRFKEFLRVTFGKENLDKNLAFVESAIGKDIRKYFVKDFYTDHIQRYKKRPIYWMFSSPKGSFNVLIYMHRYTPDTLSKILNDYLNQYREKLRGRVEHLDQVMISGSSTEQTKAAKEKDRIRGVLLELQEYERDILYPLATDRIPIDLDEGVLVNYNKFGKAIKEVAGLNDKKAKEKVRGFDWIDTSTII